jgi:YfiH family protein
MTSHLLSAAGVVHGFSLRSAGDDISLLAEAASIKGGIATARQVHGNRVVAADGREILPPTEEQAEGADAVVALDPGAAVGVRVADCFPVLLYAEDKGIAAAVHSGWRGTRLSIAARGVRALQHVTGADPHRVLAAIGPGIGRCCYEVSPDLAQLFRDRFGPEVIDDNKPKPHLDLRMCVERTLLKAGVPPERIEQVPGCTSCDIGSFFSYRRDKGATGRHLAFIVA